jgi:hypothetical protein
MGTDIHLEAERQLDDGTWERIQHAPDPCWSCGTYDRKTHSYVAQTGLQHVFCKPDEMLPGDVILNRTDNYVRLERTEPCDKCQGTLVTHPQFLNGRGYDVFAILGNVRNGTGFAGVKTSSGFVPISDGRGIPDDLSPQIRDHLTRIGYTVEQGGLVYDAEIDEDDDEGSLYEKMEAERDGYWSLGDHSFSWVLLSEIFEYDWDRSVTKEGWVDPVEFEEYRKTGSPKSWSGGVSGASVEHITEWDMAERIDSGEIQFIEGKNAHTGETETRYTTGLQRAMGDWNLPEGSAGALIRDRSSLYCAIRWEQRYRESLGSSFWQELEYLKSLAPDGDLSRVRLVFGFDS